MADKILHKRSLTPGSIPTTASLDVGELAINVNDGKLFLHQSGSTTQQIVTVGESASFAATASFLIGGVTVDTGSLVTTSSFNAYTGSVASQFAGTASFALTASYALTSAGGGGGVTYTRRSDYTSSLDPNINYLYLGEAVSGSAESATVWDITRLSISSSGATTPNSASGVAWTDRYIVTYS